MKPIKCPKCESEFQVSLDAVVPKEQTITMELRLSSNVISAKAAGQTILNFEKLQRAIAKDIGANLHVFIKAINLTEKVLTIQFFLTTVGKSEKASNENSHTN